MNIKKNNKIILGKDELSKILRISDPFLMIDKAYNITPGKNGLGSKILFKDSWFYKPVNILSFGDMLQVPIPVLHVVLSKN